MKLLLNDSSVLLNLIAGDCLPAVGADLSWQLAICPAVRDETKKLRDPATGDMIVLDIMPFVASEVLHVLELDGETEDTLYVEQSVVVDDGEAMSIAIAASRGLDLAMDDKQARNHARRAFPQLRLWTTPEILKHWVDTASVPRTKLGQIVRLIEERARYFPAASHPLAQWWTSARNAEDDYSLREQDPYLWLEEARGARLAADVLYSALKGVMPKSQTEPGVREKKLAYMHSFMLLTALAFENLLKGVAVIHKPDGWKRKGRGGHDIYNHACEYTDLSQTEADLLKRLEEYLVWAGRYIIPKKPSHYASGRKLLKFKSNDPCVISQLFDRLSAHFPSP